MSDRIIYETPPRVYSSCLKVMPSILECPALGDDASYWWDVTGKILQTLLSRAGYSAQRQHDLDVLNLKLVIALVISRTISL